MNAAEQAAFLAESHAGLDGVALLRPLVTEVFAGRVALVSSFGTEAAVLLSLVAEVDPAVPVIFLDTLKHFDATEAYRDTLIERLGLTDLRIVRPDPATLAQTDPDGGLWREAQDACCHIRKVLPLRAALRGFDAWITGRKRYQGGLRANLPTIEAEEGRIKINPLANWSPERIEEEFVARALPRHPLEAKGFYSVGCLPCTAQTAGRETHAPVVGPAVPRRNAASICRIGLPQSRARPNGARMRCWVAMSGNGPNGPGPAVRQPAPGKNRMYEAGSSAAAARTHEEPEDEAQEGKDHGDQNPKNLAAAGGVALKNAHDRPDIQDEEQKADNAEFGAHEGCSLPYSLRPASAAGHCIPPAGPKHRPENVP